MVEIMGIYLEQYCEPVGKFPPLAFSLPSDDLTLTFSMVSLDLFCFLPLSDKFVGCPRVHSPIKLQECERLHAASNLDSIPIMRTNRINIFSHKHMYLLLFFVAEKPILSVRLL